MSEGSGRTDTKDTTILLNDWANGNRDALDQLIPRVERELRRLAQSYMRREPRRHTLQTTALVNEAYLRLIDQKNVGWRNRSHFFAIAAKLMRRILIDHARKRQAAKRGAERERVPLEEVQELEVTSPEGLLALHQALLSLADANPRQSGIVELRYFGGLNNKEIAEVLKISVATVKRDWTVARTWLYRELSGRGSVT